MPGFLKHLLRRMVREAAKFVIAFAVGTAVGGFVCWYYNIPMVFSLLGGLIVLGIALFLISDMY